MSSERERLDAAMAQVAKGNRSALASVYEMTSAKLFGTILRVVRSRERAEDLLQDVYVKVWRRAGSFDRSKGAPITWLCTVARNTALNDLRRAGRSVEITDEALQAIPDDTVSPADDWLCDKEDSLALKHCLDTLQPDHRSSIINAYFEGYSQSELADRRSVPLGTMKSWIRRGLAGLKGCLDG